MTYDKDIRVCRQTMIVLGVLMVVGLVINLIARNWINAGSFTLWIWACFTTVKTAKTHQKSRDETRAAMADMMRTWADTAYKPEIRARRVIDGLKMSDDPQKKAEGLAIEDLMDKAYGYRSYTCPKCGRLSHLPAEVEPYCIECLAEANL